MEIPIRQVGRYELIRELGRGNMGIVFEAQDQQLRRRVALKILPPELTFDEALVERFLREGRSAAALAHPNIVSVYDVGEADGCYYLAMEFVDGKSLKSQLEDEHLHNFPAAHAVLSQLASALDAAHEAGIIHRDVKPENVLIEANGRVKLSDFGIARIQAEVGGTATGLALGSADYAPPEQVLGKAVDARSDVYSLACVAFEMMTGEPPFGRASEQRSAISVMHDHAHLNATWPRATRYPVPAGARSAVLRGLSKEMQDRFPSSGEFVAALNQPAPFRFSRRQLTGAAAAGIFVAAGVLLKGSRARGRRSNLAGSPAAVKPDPAIWFIRHDNGWRISNRAGEEGELLANGGLGIAWNERRGLFLLNDGKRLHTIEAASGEQRCIAPGETTLRIGGVNWLDPDTVVYERGRFEDGSEFAELWLLKFDGAGGGKYPVLETGDFLSCHSPQLSPDGEKVAYLGLAESDGGWLLMDDRKTNVRRQGSVSGFAFTYETLVRRAPKLCFSPDGSLLALAGVRPGDLAAEVRELRLAELAVESDAAAPNLKAVRTYVLPAADGFVVDRVVPYWLRPGEILCEAMSLPGGELSASRFFRIDRESRQVTELPTAPPIMEIQSDRIRMPKVPLQVDAGPPGALLPA